jgi:cysteine desulfurase/selenocysteine lyase
VAVGTGVLDVAEIRREFPIYANHADRPFVFLDSAASSQKPRSVLEAMDGYYATTHANVHRGVYAMAEEATARYEGARESVARFIGATRSREVVFTKNVTESLNLVASAWGGAHLRSGDVVVLTEMEHHSNLVPWLMLAEQKGLELRYLGVTDDGSLDLSDLEQKLDGARVVAVTAMSNVLGTLPPVRQIADAAHAAGALVVIDGSQAVPHMPVDVPAIGADFYAFTGHKMLGPTGIGVLVGRIDVLEGMEPFLGGGEMISDVTTAGSTWAQLPWKFEAGTPPIAEAVGLDAAVRTLERYDMRAVRAHEVAVTGYALRTLAERFGDDLVLHGPADPCVRGGVLSFAFLDVHPHDLAQVLDSEGVCVRAGHHCAKPLMRRMGVGATTRASFYVYNDEADVDALGDAIEAVRRVFG